MHGRERRIVLGLAAWVVAAPALADDLTGSNRFVCSGWHASRCTADGNCDNTVPWRLNVPDFVRLDLGNKLISTTAVHSDSRSTPIEGSQRSNGLILLHGQQDQSAWSWVINESSGEGTLTISSQDAGITIFSACAPIEALEAVR